MGTLTSTSTPAALLHLHLLLKEHPPRRVRLLPPEKASKTLKVGEFTRARIVAAEGHDLVGVPV